MTYVKGSYFTVVEDGDSKIKDSQYLAPTETGGKHILPFSGNGFLSF